MPRFFRRLFRRHGKESADNNGQGPGPTRSSAFTPQASAPGTHVCTSLCEGIASLPPQYHESIIAQLTRNLGEDETPVRIRTENMRLTNFEVVPDQSRYIGSEMDERQAIEGNTEPALGLDRRSLPATNENPSLGLALPTTYQYPPLPQGHSRFLRFGGLGTHPMAYLESHPLDKPPPYVAISYSWDPTSPRRSMFVDMQSFSVSETVLEVLNQAQASQIARGARELIWIDQLCINQSDQDEKLNQIYRMGEIYSKAERVFVWLGPTANQSDLALANMRRMLAEVAELNQATATREDVGDDAATIINEDHGQMYGHLFMRPWFRRLWVVPEAMLARKLVIMCGYQEVDFDLLYEFAVKIMVYGSLDLFQIPGASEEDMDTAIIGITTLRSLRLRGRSPGLRDRLLGRRSASTETMMQGLEIGNFGDLVTRSRGRQVTLPPDRVHALMGVAPRQVREYMAGVRRAQPSQSLWKLYAEFAKCMLENDPKWYFLSSAPSKDRPSELPSWVPNLNSQKPFASEFNHDFCNFSAGISPQTRHLVDRTATAEELTARGFRLGTVTDVIPQTAFREDNHRTKRGDAYDDDTREWDEKCTRLCQRVFNLGPEQLPAFHVDILLAQSAAEPAMAGRAMDAYHLFWTACRLRSETLALIHRQDAPLPEPFRHHPDGADRFAERAVKLWVDKLPLEEYGMLLEFTNGIKFMCSGRPYINTGTRWLGLGCPGVQVGDVVCILYGTTVPYVLRSRPDGAMTFVGDAYIHQAMNGESLALRDKDPGGMIRIR